MLNESLRLSANPMITSPPTMAALDTEAAPNPTMRPTLVTIAAVPPKLYWRGLAIDSRRVRLSGAFMDSSSPLREQAAEDPDCDLALLRVDLTERIACANGISCTLLARFLSQ